MKQFEAFAFLARAILLGVAAACMPAWAQTQITGSMTSTPAFTAAAPQVQSIQVTFSCAGAPTCTGTYRMTFMLNGCASPIVHGGSMVLTIDTTKPPGPITLGFSFAGGSVQVNYAPLCSVAPVTDLNNSATGTWDGSSGTFNFLQVGPGSYLYTGSFVVPRPVFGMQVRSTIDPVRANASADIQFRPQDVGTTGSVYVFAVAPSAIVKGGFEKADACVISQLNAAGQLVAVTTAQLQAYLSGTLNASGASVNILTNTPTSNVAGATFYVGYGPTASAMLNNGVFRNAVIVPGSNVCPMLPSLTALWWNPGESGWGLNLNHQGSTVFGTLFTYDATRAPLWLVMSGGAMQADGVSYTGDLYRTTGPAFNAVPFPPIGPSNLTRVGTMSLSFSDANAGSLTYTVNGVSVTKTIQRQVYGTRAANCLPTSDSRVASANYQDLWWNRSESGWGLNVTHQDSTLFATLFTYDATGRNMWLVMSSGTRQADGSYLGDLYRTAGPAFDTLPFTAVTVSPVGTMRLRFTDGNTGTLTYSYNGVTVTKNIERQVFASPVSTCN